MEPNPRNERLKISTGLCERASRRRVRSRPDGPIAAELHKTRHKTVREEGLCPKKFTAERRRKKCAAELHGEPSIPDGKGGWPEGVEHPVTTRNARWLYFDRIRNL